MTLLFNLNSFSAFLRFIDWTEDARTKTDCVWSFDRVRGREEKNLYLVLLNFVPIGFV